MKDYNAEVNAIMRFLEWAWQEKNSALAIQYYHAEPYTNQELERMLDKYIQQRRSTHPWE